MAGQGMCSSQPWSVYSPCHQERPSAVVVQSICAHAPLRSISGSSLADVPQPLLRRPGVAPYTALNDMADQQLVLLRCNQQQRWQQQNMLEQLMEAPTATQQTRDAVKQHSGQPNLHSQQDTKKAVPAPVQELISAAKRQLRLEPLQWQLLLQQVVPLLPVLPPSQLARTAKAASLLPCGPAATAATSGWRSGLLSAALSHFTAGSMDEQASYVLLDALVKLRIQPGPDWLQAACAGMQLATWGGRSLSTVAACLAQLGFVPSRSWAAGYFAASVDKLQGFPAISLARMLHGVVAWYHLQQQQQRQGEQQQQLELPHSWLCRLLQQLHSSSGALKPCEVAMVLQALQRLQQWGVLSNSSSNSMQQSTAQHDSLLQACAVQLLLVLVPAVTRRRQQFAAQDLAVVLYSLALLQQRGHGGVQGKLSQQAQELCSLEWLHQVLGVVQERLFDANARTQTTSLWAVAALMQPHLQQQQQQRHQQQQMLQQQQQQPDSLPAQPTPLTTEALLASLQPQHVQLQRPHGQSLLARPVWQGIKPPHQQNAAAADVSAASAAAAAPAAATTGIGTAAGPVQAPLPDSHTLPGQAGMATSSTALAAAGTGAAALWSAWLDCFYAASLPRLAQHYSSEDLVISAATLATQQQVPPVAWYQQLLAAVQWQLRGLSPGQVSGLAWALARMALLPCRHNPGASLVPLQPWLHHLYAHSGLGVNTHAATASAAAAAGTHAAAAADGGDGGSAAQGMRPVLQETLQEGSRHAVRAAEVVRLMWAAGVCEYAPGDAWWAAAEQQLLAHTPARPRGGHRPYSSSSSSGGVISTADSTTAASHHGSWPNEQQQAVPAVSYLPARLLGALLQAYVSAGRQLPPALLEAVLTPAACQQLCEEPVVNTFRLLQALLRTDSSISQPWLQQLAAGLQPRLAGFTPWELGQLLLCLGDAGLQVQHLARQAATDSAVSAIGSSTVCSSSRWAAEVVGACQLQLGAMTARDVSMILSGTAKLQLQLPPALQQALLQQMQLGFLDAPPAALAVAIDAITRMGIAPSRDWLGGFLMATHRTFTAAAAAHSSGGSTRQRVALVRAIMQALQGLSRLKAGLPAKWLKQLLLLLHGQLPVLQPRHVASLLLLLSRMRVRPSPMYLDSMVGHLGDCRACNAADLVQLAYGMASLRWQPRRQWMQLFLAASVDKLPEMSTQGLALLLWALAVTRVTPPERSWRRVAVQAVAAHLGQFNALQMSWVVWALGRLSVHLTPLPNRAAASRQLGLLQQRRWQQQQQRQQQEQQGQHYEEVPQLAAGASAVTAVECSGGVLPGKLNPKQRWQLQEGRPIAEQLLVAAVGLCGTYNASQLTHLLVGVAKMQLRPNQRWLHIMVATGSSEPLSGLSGYHMQQLLWSLACMGYRAPASWVQAMGVLLETRHQQHDCTRHSAVWALQQLQKLALVPQVQPAHHSYHDSSC